MKRGGHNFSQQMTPLPDVKQWIGDFCSRVGIIDTNKECVMKDDHGKSKTIFSLIPSFSIHEHI